jgi:hypothetical protein
VELLLQADQPRPMESGPEIESSSEDDDADTPIDGVPATTG